MNNIIYQIDGYQNADRCKSMQTVMEQSYNKLQTVRFTDGNKIDVYALNGVTINVAWDGRVGLVAENNKSFSRTKYDLEIKTGFSLIQNGRKK